MSPLPHNLLSRFWKLWNDYVFLPGPLFQSFNKFADSTTSPHNPGSSCPRLSCFIPKFACQNKKSSKLICFNLNCDIKFGKHQFVLTSIKKAITGLSTVVGFLQYKYNWCIFRKISKRHIQEIFSIFLLDFYYMYAPLQFFKML